MEGFRIDLNVKCSVCNCIWRVTTSKWNGQRISGTIRVHFSTSVDFTFYLAIKHVAFVDKANLVGRTAILFHSFFQYFHLVSDLKLRLFRWNAFTVTFFPLSDCNVIAVSFHSWILSFILQKATL